MFITNHVSYSKGAFYLHFYFLNSTCKYTNIRRHTHICMTFCRVRVKAFCGFLTWDNAACNVALINVLYNVVLVQVLVNLALVTAVFDSLN